MGDVTFWGVFVVWAIAALVLFLDTVKQGGRL